MLIPQNLIIWAWENLLALDFIEKSVAKNNVKAQYALADFYSDASCGLPKDMGNAVKLYEKSAGQNNLDAIVDLGIAYEKGEGVEMDMKKAIELFTIAMKQDDSFATFKIAAFYETGEYLKKDPQLALNLFKKSAMLGDTEAIKVLEEYRQAAQKRR